MLRPLLNHYARRPKTACLFFIPQRSALLGRQKGIALPSSQHFTIRSKLDSLITRNTVAKRRYSNNSSDAKTESSGAQPPQPLITINTKSRKMQLLMWAGAFVFCIYTTDVVPWAYYTLHHEELLPYWAGSLCDRSYRDLLSTKKQHILAEHKFLFDYEDRARVSRSNLRLGKATPRHSFFVCRYTVFEDGKTKFVFKVVPILIFS